LEQLFCRPVSTGRTSRQVTTIPGSPVPLCVAKNIHWGILAALYAARKVSKFI
jgi:hypothetical protein